MMDPSSQLYLTPDRSLQVCKVHRLSHESPCVCNSTTVSRTRGRYRRRLHQHGCLPGRSHLPSLRDRCSATLQRHSDPWIEACVPSFAKTSLAMVLFHRYREGFKIRIEGERYVLLTRTVRRPGIAPYPLYQTCGNRRNKPTKL